ncbi:L,D-transpeptidase [Methylobacterium sp. JK268]
MIVKRRSFLLGLPLWAAGCAARREPVAAVAEDPVDPAFVAMYAAITTEPYPVPAVDPARIPPRFWRREVADPTGQRPGTIVVDPAARHAYLVLEGGRAVRYGVGVGREEAFNFRGTATIARKAEWPGWRPTPAMIAREPERYGPVRDGLPGGEGNPLGPRALYLYRDGRDTYYRLHGTVEPWTIGTTVSSGCVRFINQDIIDLYGRAPIGTTVIVLPADRPLA